jgi:hypothetical protein
MTLNTMKNFLFASTCALLAFAGCSPAGDASDPVQAVQRDQLSIASCTCWGTYTCTSNGFEIDYAPPRCGAALKPNAASTCKSMCGGVACVDTGWLCGGVNPADGGLATP